MSKIIACPNCGQKNRIHRNANISKAICSKCWTKLSFEQKAVKAPPLPKERYSPPATENKNNDNNRSKFIWLWLLPVVVIIWWGIVHNSNNKIKNPRLYSDQDYPKLAMPYNGSIQFYTNEERIAPLTIETSNGANYFLKLVSAYSQTTVMTIFIRGGNTVSTEVPLGEYYIKYASGSSWYGTKYLFGVKTRYNKAEKILIFEHKRYQISGYTITLYRVPNGNLRTSSIPPSQF